MDSKHEKLKVLLVDDDEIIRIYFHDIFWIHGFEKDCELTITEDLDQAEAVMADPAKRPDIIFLDLGLPKKVDGRTIIDPKYSFEFTRKIKEDPSLAHIKIFIFSGHSEAEFREEAKTVHADGYIDKGENLVTDIVRMIAGLVADSKK